MTWWAPGPCPRCGGQVIWTVTLKKGKTMAVDREPAPDGRIRLLPVVAGPPVSEVAGPPGPGERRYRVHKPTCDRRRARRR